MRGVAQPGRVLRSGRRSRRFKSSHPDQIAQKIYLIQYHADVKKIPA